LFVLEIKEFCNHHNERLQSYCKEHGCPCCGICIVEDHNEFKDLAILKNVVKNVKTSHNFNESEQLIREMMENIHKIRQNRENNSVTVTEQKRIIEQEIRELREEINNHLDKLQEDLLNELTEDVNIVTRQTSELMVSLDEKQKELSEYKTNMVNIKQYASDLQTFLALKQIGSDVEGQDTYLHALVNSDSLKQTKISCNIDTSLKNLATSIQSFGEVVVESTPCEITFVRKKDKQAQIMVSDHLSPMSVDNIHLNLTQKVNTKGKTITGCSLLPDGRMVFSCYEKHIVTFLNKEGVELFQICKDKIGSCNYDTLYIKEDNSVAVSCGGAGKTCITIIDIESKKVMTTISMDTIIYGMAIRGRTMYCCARSKGLKTLNLSDKSVSDIRNMTHVIYVATLGDKLYYTNYNIHTVTCCDLQGTTQWEFKDERVLKCPLGISVDNDGNVYVAGHESINVVVISPDGQRHRQLLCSTDGLILPRVLDYEKSTNKLLVVNGGDIAFLFDVSRGQ
jgi:DNA-binding beta-propeller fold protein YncE